MRPPALPESFLHSECAYVTPMPIPSPEFVSPFPQNLRDDEVESGRLAMSRCVCQSCFPSARVTTMPIPSPEFASSFPVNLRDDEVESKTVCRG
jgi:hypothetical protein